MLCLMILPDWLHNLGLSDLTFLTFRRRDQILYMDVQAATFVTLLGSFKNAHKLLKGFIKENLKRKPPLCVTGGPPSSSVSLRNLQRTHVRVY